MIDLDRQGRSIRFRWLAWVKHVSNTEKMNCYKWGVEVKQKHIKSIRRVIIVTTQIGFGVPRLFVRTYKDCTPRRSN